MINRKSPLNKRNDEDFVTSHNISILILIDSYLSLKDSLQLHANCKREFYLLLIRLLQAPDLNCNGFVEEICKDDFQLDAQLILKFNNKVAEIVDTDMDAMLEFIQHCNSYVTEDDSSLTITTTSVNPTSYIGIFIRKMVLSADKLTFPEAIRMYKLYKKYCGRSNVSLESTQCRFLDETLQYELQKPFSRLFGITSTHNLEGDDHECLSWSRAQTELFLSQQAAFLELNETLALPAHNLQRKLDRIASTNPEFSEVYYVSYLNSIRCNELNGAINSLHSYVDSKCSAFEETDKSKAYRYAALTLAVLHAQFNQRCASMTALKECITLSHEANDSTCLQYANAWMSYLTSNSIDSGIEDIVAKCKELSLYQLASLRLLTQAKQCSMYAESPKAVFQNLDMSDALNSEQMLPELSLTSLTTRAAKWEFYGWNKLSCYTSQIVLNTRTTNAIYGLRIYNTESVCIAICNVALTLIYQGSYNLAKIVLNHAKERFPVVHRKWWLLCEQILLYTQAINLQLWNDAQNACTRISLIDPIEGVLRSSEMYFERGENKAAMQCLRKILASNDDLCPTRKMRALLLAARTRKECCLPFLEEADKLAKKHHNLFIEALVQFELAKHQFERGAVSRATRLLNKCSVIILMGNDYMEQASLYFLLGKCKAVEANYANDRKAVLREAISILEAAKNLYKSLYNQPKEKEIVYLQALLSNEANLTDERNNYARQYRKLEEESIIV